MIRGFPVKTTAALALASFAPLVCANPYKSRLDRQYESLSRSIERAYSPPPPRPTYTPPTRSYSSSSTYSTPSSSSSSRSSSSSSGYTWTPQAESYSAAERFAAEKRRLEAKRAAEKEAQFNKSPAGKAAAAKKAASAKKEAEAAAARSRVAERERQRREPVLGAAAWSSLRLETKGKAPLVAPPAYAVDLRGAEFPYFAPIARARGAAAPWENLRAGQLSLLLVGLGAEPAGALAFFRNADPAWPETQLGLGLCYLRGFGTAPDPEKARAHLEKAAAPVASGQVVRGYRATGELFPNPAFEAARELGVAYDLGKGLPADPTLALRWYEHAAALPLTAPERENIQALLREYWRKNSGRARELALSPAGPGAPGGARGQVFSESLLAHLVATKDATALFDLGELLSAEPAQVTAGFGCYLAAAKLGHEPAARAWFSPTRRGGYIKDLGGDWSRPESAQFAREQWPAWEKKFLAAAAAGDATAHIPLAFHYSGARGNPGNPDRYQHHFRLLPGTMPDVQRQTILNGPLHVAIDEARAWFPTVYAALGGDYQTIDLRKLKLPADPARAAALRDEADALAERDPRAARDRIRDAAALGDLPAQAQLWSYAKRHQVSVSAYSVSLKSRLEEAAAAGDRGAMATLAVSVSDFWNGNTDEAAAWRDKVRALAPHKAAFARIVAEPSLTDEQAEALRTAALVETARWHAEARKWGLVGTNLIYDLTLKDETVERSDDLRRQYVALAAIAGPVATQLAQWEESVEAGEFDPAADARFVQGLIAWAGPKDERDVPAGFDALVESAAMGHPLAPLALGYFFGSGHGGFPKDVAIAKRCRALADARLTALAEDGDGWAQAMLGGLLTATIKPEDADDPNAHPSIYAWLPFDGERGVSWLRTAALAGHTLPEFFDNRSGHTVASIMISHAENEAEAARWKLIDEVFTYGVDEKSPEAAAQFSRALAKAQEIIAERPEASLARAKLEHVINQGDTEAEQCAARLALARMLIAVGIPQLARMHAGVAARTLTLDAAAWTARAEIEAACGAPELAAACRAFAQTLAREPSAAGRFAAAFAKLNSEDQGELRNTIEVTLEEHPQSAPLKELMTTIDRVAPKN